MPLIHSKTPKAFKKNIEIERHAGKPEKQSVAIAYSEKAEAEHKKHASSGGCIGAMCKGCHDPECFAEGGNVHEDQGAEYPSRKGQSQAGAYVRAANKSKETNYLNGAGETYNKNSAKDLHIEKLAEMRSMKKPNLYAEGGCVGPECSGCSAGDCYAEGGPVGPTLGSIIGYPGSAPTAPIKKAEGGEVDDDDGEIHGMLGEELMGALERKDKKAILDCIEACVMQCLSKG